jgi:hypothetical protein
LLRTYSIAVAEDDRRTLGRELVLGLLRGFMITVFCLRARDPHPAGHGLSLVAATTSIVVIGEGRDGGSRRAE